MRKILKYFLTIIIFIIITVIFAIPDFGNLWDNLSDSFSWVGYFTLILYRLSIYLVPGFILWLIFKKENLVYYYKIQFVSYSIVKLAWEFFALDYIWSTEIFSRIELSIVLVGLLLSVIFKRKIKLKTEI